MKTKYVVLFWERGEQDWDGHGFVRQPEVIEAYSPDEARKIAAADRLAAGVAVSGEIVAVPTRHWNPVRVEPQQQTTLAFGADIQSVANALEAEPEPDLPEAA